MSVQCILQNKKIQLALIVVQVLMYIDLHTAFCADETEILSADKFIQIAPEGFGDPDNNAAWSMKWWQGKLYVGTVRCWFCWATASAHAEYPIVPYPGNDPDRKCSESPLDLPLQAEIWRYTPETEKWERVYQSPQDIPIPLDPTKFVARDVGFRGMEIFTEPDGTEALYVFGANARRWTMTDDEEVPCPRILRTTDGVTFDALQPDPQHQPCVEGYDGVIASYRSSAVFKDRFFITAGNLQGTGVLLESDNPASGKENLKLIIPDNIRIWDMEPFNEYLYIGTRDETGYSILKTTAEGTPPYTFIPVITQGAYQKVNPSVSIVNMHVFNNRLYVGTDKPAEMIRINPDDTWDLVVGRPRRTPDGKKYPISGFNNGFNWSWNAHIWRMQEHEGVLYAGTADQSTRMRRVPVVGKLLESGFGFDLYASENGWYWTPITTNGFGDKWQMGLRTFASTPYGLFLGTCNFWGGLQIWLGKSDTQNTSILSVNNPQAPADLEAEQTGTSIILSWYDMQQNVLYRVFRSTYDVKNSYNPYIEIGKTNTTFYIDTQANKNQTYTYYVIAENNSLNISEPSNIVSMPNFFPKATFTWIQNNVFDFIKITSPEIQKLLMKVLSDARISLKKKNFENALSILQNAKIEVSGNGSIAPWHAENLTMILNKLMRRITLVKEGILSDTDLY